MPSAPLPVISAITAGVLIVLQMALAGAVVIARRRNQQSLGDGGNPAVLRAVRRHGNFAENAALFIVGFALFELLGGRRGVLESWCVVFVLGRLSHAIGLSMEPSLNRPRVLGVVATIGVGIALGTRLIALGFAHLPITK